MLPLCGFPFLPKESLTNPSFVTPLPALMACLRIAITYLPLISLSVLPPPVSGTSIKIASPTCKAKSGAMSISTTPVLN